MSQDRVEEIDMWLLIWGEGIGLPKEIWTDARLQREILDCKPPDAAGIMRALRVAAISHNCREIMDSPRNQLECMTVVNTFLNKSDKE